MSTARARKMSKLSNVKTAISSDSLAAQCRIKPFGLVSGTKERCKCGIFHLVERINTAGIAAVES